MSKQIDFEKLRKHAERGVPLGSSQILELVQHITELEKDAARLDWMDKQGRVCIERVRECHIKGAIRWDVEFGYNDDSAKSKQGMRQAIDTAMEASNAKAD